jgi:hypothetical protein
MNPLEEQKGYKTFGSNTPINATTIHVVGSKIKE